MSLTAFVATATTSDVSPGTEEIDGSGRLQIRDRVFTDIVESNEERIAGINTPALDLDVDPENGTGALRGSFVMTPDAVAGTWEGEVSGVLEGGMVSAGGLARGTGDLAGAIMHIAFQQVAELPGEAPCAEPKAFFKIEGLILQ